MEIISDQKITDSILFKLERIKYEKEHNEIIKLFPLEKIFIWGGFIRDCIVEKEYGLSIQTKDLDLLVDDLSFEKKTNHLERRIFSGKGSLKLTSLNFNIDILNLQEIYFLNQTPPLEKNLENALKGVDFSTSSLAYNLKSGHLYNYRALQDIYKKEINVLNNYMKVGPTIAKLIIHANKMNFNLGKSAKEYIKNNYSEKIEGDILEYLGIKNQTSFFPTIKEEIGNLLKK